MLRERAHIFKNFDRAADGVVIIISYLLAYIIRANLPSLSSLSPLIYYLWLLVLIVPIWLVLFTHFGLYESQRMKSISDQFVSVLKGVLIGGVAVVSIFFLFKYTRISRIFLFIFLFLDITFLWIEKAIVRECLWRIRRRGRNFRNIFLVSEGDDKGSFYNLVEKHPEWGLKVVHRLRFNPDSKKITKKFTRYLKENVVDSVFFDLSSENLGKIAPMLQFCEEMGIESHTLVDIHTPVIAKPYVENFFDMPVITFSTTTQRFIPLLVKNISDRILSLFSLAILSPLFILISILIKVTSRGPVLFRQKRVSKNGRIFTFYKFRTMVEDADKIKDNFEHLDETIGPIFKIRRDPRVTEVGRILRRFSLDELPQLFNVIIGDMSIVGPRPPIPEEVELYKTWQRRRLSMKPGITCLWQVSGRSSLDFENWVELDLWYIDNWSLSIDLEILLRTIPAVLTGKGAW